MSPLIVLGKINEALNAFKKLNKSERKEFLEYIEIIMKKEKGNEKK